MHSYYCGQRHSVESESIFIHTLCVRDGKALTRLRGNVQACPIFFLLAECISTKFSYGDQDIPHSQLYQTSKCIPTRESMFLVCLILKSNKNIILLNKRSLLRIVFLTHPSEIERTYIIKSSKLSFIDSVHEN